MDSAKPNLGQRLKSQAHLLLLATTLILPATCAFYMGPGASPDARKWAYENQSRWRNEYRECGRRAQSPIDIQRKDVILNTQLKLRFYNYYRPIKFNLENGHHTIKMSPARPEDLLNGVVPLHEITSGQSQEQQMHQHRPGRFQSNNQHDPVHPQMQPSEDEPEFETGHASANHEHGSGADPFLRSASDSGFGRARGGRPALSGAGDERDRPANFDGAPAIKLDWMDDGNNEFTLRDIHFHWGERKDNGSEHAIDGRRSAMEMHLVHVRHGLSGAQVGHESDSVVVLAVLIESYRKSNADFNPIVNALGKINATKRVQPVEYKSLLDLLPSNLDSFYTYSGSLTTPPCSQVVNWIVMTDRLYLNAKQIEMFRNLYAPAEHGPLAAHQWPGATEPEGLEPLTPNVRALQPLNNRTILASFAPFSRIEGSPNSAAPMKISWLLLLVELQVALVGILRHLGCLNL